MAEVDISPLAKRLAEENNVDWRALSGSGDDGRIVERDVLDYLARVMAGDEAADPTPEPLPDGMQAWPDQPGVQESGAGWDQDEEPDPPAAAADDDLLEVESAEAAPAASDDWSRDEWGAADWGQGGASTGDGDDDFFAGMGELGGEHSESAAEDGFDFGGDEDSGSFDFGGESEQYHAGGASDGGADFDFGSGSAGEDRSVFDTGSMEPAIDEGIFVFDDDEPAAADAAAESPADPADAAEAFDFGEDSPAASTGAAESPVPVGETASASGDSFDFGGEGRPDSAADTVGDSEHTPWEGSGATAAEVEEEVAAAADEGENPWQPAEPAATDLPSSDAPWTAVADEAPTGGQPAAAASGTYDYLDGGDETLPDGVRIEEDEHRVVRSGAFGAAATAATVETATLPTTPRPPKEGRGVVSGGIVLRREVDVTALIEASAALAAELGGQPSLAAFLLRAAARAGSPWPLTDAGDEVGLAKLSDDGISVAVVRGASGMQFRDLITASAGGASAGDSAALAVADVSQLGIDEAVVDLGSPVLTIGRVLESDLGRRQATLTLSGHDAPESGSKFLGRVAELLAAPVRLVV